MIIKIKDENFSYLAARGMPKDIIRTRPFESEQHLITIDSKVEGIKNRRVPKKLQLQILEKLVAKPFSHPGIIVISSFPNDNKAKALAAFLMEKATGAHLYDKIKLTRNKTLPLWHTLTGGYYDKMRDSQHNEKPSMLILGNLAQNSTQQKLEKARDLLELHTDIPRILVTTSEDPLTFVNTKLFVSVSSAFYLATARTIQI
jgi:hypothetical protein